MPRRRAGVLLPVEEAILTVGLRRLYDDEPEFYGFAIAEQLAAGADAMRLLGHGTLYKALGRLEQGGLLESRWEDIDASVEGRPRRRLYRVTSNAASALAHSQLEQGRGAQSGRRSWAST